jgi:S-DNA-T family DNA segregation ATPase FtsK/SpoIIIE
MDNNQLIGEVAASYLRERLPDLDSTTTARYLIDSLSAEQTAAIAKAILSDTTLNANVELRLPSQWLAGFELPSTCLTHERATYYRNAPCSKPMLLIATPGDDERQSLADLMVIDSAQLRSHVGLWVKVASAGLPLPEQHLRWWLAALTGLQDVAHVTLNAFSLFTLQIRKHIEDGKILLHAIGEALPALQWPRNQAMFRSLNDKTAGYPSKWKGLFQQVQKKQACYLKKYRPNNQLLSADELTSSFENVMEVIPENYHKAIRDFIAAPSKWNREAEALASIEWEIIKPLFDGLKPEKFNLGQATIEFYGDRGEDLISREESEYLDVLANKRRTSEALPEDVEFYRRHRHELKEDPVLKSKWDKFIFGSPIETKDFLVGLTLCLESLFDQEFPEGAKRTLRVVADRRSKGELKKLNVDAGRYFALRYRGLRKLIGTAVFDVGYLFDYEDLQTEWAKNRKYKPVISTARAALEIKFYIDLEVGDGDIKNHRQLIWRFDPNAISSAFFHDWARLIEHPLTIGEVSREPVGPKGEAQALDLRTVKTLSAAFGQDRGSLVPVYRKDRDLAVAWKKNLQSAVERGSISAGVAAELLAAFDEFYETYRGAVSGFAKISVAAPEIGIQYVTYGKLIETVSFKAKGDRNRDLLLKPLLAIGVVPVHGAATAAIIAPWNPLRMQAMASKALRVAQLIRHLVTAPTVRFGDPGLYFKEVREELEHTYYPEIALGWRERQPELLSTTDSFMDYSLHELPLSGDSTESDTNENPVQSASQIVEIVQRYLALFPHEQANLSVVLYNCDAASLPQAVVDKINELHEDESDMRCEVVLRHRDRIKLHKLYENILESSDTDTDGFVSSEASRDFMARLRIGIMADEAPIPDSKDGPSKDVVFLHDVISRHAKIEWYREDATPVNVNELIPSSWSRRRPSPGDEQKSIVYLCSPVQSKEGWDYITAIASFFRPDWDTAMQPRYLPARQLDFSDPETERIFEETHHLANWVVNFDELLDRRQLLNQGVRVIRYKQSSTQGRNVLVSSNASLGLLQSMLQNRIKDLITEMDDSDVRALAKRFIEDANLISGDIVLRAAKRGRNASELMGIVLSYFLLKSELGVSRRVGCYFLDDYSEWLGQREEQIADLLLLSPEVMPDGSRQLSVVISEAKYINEGSLAEKRKESQKQLRDTIRRIGQALFGDPERLDRQLWLARFSDLLLSGIPYSADEPLDLVAFRRAVREGRCQIYIRGYSHVFVSGPANGTECSDFVEVAEAMGCYQETYSRAKTRALVTAYAKGLDPGATRYTVADLTILRNRKFRDISPTVQAGGSADRVLMSTASVALENRKKVEVASLQDVMSETPAGTDDPALQALAQGGGAQKHNSEQSETTTRAWSYSGIQELVSAHATAPTRLEEDREWLRSTVSKARSALQQFQLNSKLSSEPKLTPNAAIVRFVGASNMTVEQILKRRSEFLTTHGLDLIAVRGEPGAVAISIARPSREVLYTLDVWKKWAPDCEGGNHKVLVGVKEEDSEPLLVSPTDNAPHTLIAGATGSGKSVLMQNIILSIACTNTMEQARILLIDPKLGVDYFAFEGLPHLDGGIVEEQEEAIKRLGQLLVEMDRRYSVLKANRCANIFELNRKPNATERLPCLWVIHDEFAEWMMTEAYSQTVANVVSRLGVKARAAGIFLIFAAQRPDSQVMPLQLRSNLGNRLVLRVDSEGTSEIALGGDKGAERLLGRGHMVAKLEGYSGLIYAQVPLVSSEEIRSLVSAIARTDA